MPLRAQPRKKAMEAALAINLSAKAPLWAEVIQRSGGIIEPLTFPAIM
jgi:hypothetical protein